MPEYAGCCVSFIGIYEHAWDDTMSVEGLAVGEVCVGLSCIGGGVVPVYVRRCWVDMRMRSGITIHRL